MGVEDTLRKDKCWKCKVVGNALIVIIIILSCVFIYEFFKPQRFIDIIIYILCDRKKNAV